MLYNNIDNVSEKLLHLQQLKKEYITDLVNSGLVMRQ